MKELLSREETPAPFLLSKNLSVIYEDLKDKKFRSCFFNSITNALQLRSSFSEAFLERLEADDLIIWSEDDIRNAEPVGEESFSYYRDADHQQMNEFLCAVAESPSGLTKMKQGDIAAIKKFVSAHDREYDYKPNWSRIVWNHHGKCDEGCHGHAKKILELLE